jgi:hypothetical protein
MSLHAFPTGRPAAVAAEFDMLEQIRVAGGGAGVMGSHICASPVIEVSVDGRTAKAACLDRGHTLFSAAFPDWQSLNPPPGVNYLLKEEAGDYAFKFINTKNGWKILYVKWTAVYSKPPVPIDETQGFPADPTVNFQTPPMPGKGYWP